ncbi:MAG: sugar ABC transporter substrate-binding protein [Lacrimispora sphenoides]|uniref:Ribose transport system substrate-binding protein n=1 Tax=Lacrimispora sphenoides JCM 1415 TaxID=1297793 RepID=A0ABY1CG25_9FIRM|nr:sugar ABC transporter substrate-binding protein [Lacrimispora sphenoides]SEU02105.1 ribose transport system substrate-binding protein [[Clostridium] sphenoides JCM 1415]SUY48630.1 LacI family transcriptional regulator [Lacrimispora sphenoides]
MKRKILSMLLVSAILASVTGCGEQKTVSQPTATEKTASGDITVGVILKTLSSEYWGYVAAGVQAASKDLGVKVDLQGPASETAYDEQNNMIETMLSGGVDAFVISPLQSDSVASVIGDVKIPVITVDTDAEIPGKVSFVGTGNDNAAYQGGLFAAKKAGKGAKAAIIGGVEGNATSDARQAGYIKALEENGVEVVSIQYAQSNPDTAANVMENIITAQNGDIQIVCCHNDDTAAGASNAVKQLGLKDVIIVGFDGNQSGVQNIIDGNITATCAQAAYTMGYQAVETALKAIKGETVDTFVDTGCEVITADNAEEYLTTLKGYLK